MYRKKCIALAQSHHWKASDRQLQGSLAVLGTTRTLSLVLLRLHLLRGILQQVSVNFLRLWLVFLFLSLGLCFQLASR
jgi:hypothetical protein